MSDRGHPHQWPVVAPRRPEPRAEMPGGAETPAAVSSQSSHSSVSLQFFSVLSSVSSSSVVSANEEVTCCSMTVRPLTSHTRYWGPSQTFVTKTGGVKYITDQVRGTYS